MAEDTETHTRGLPESTCRKSESWGVGPACDSNSDGPSTEGRLFGSVVPPKTLSQRGEEHRARSHHALIWVTTPSLSGVQLLGERLSSRHLAP